MARTKRLEVRLARDELRALDRLVRMRRTTRSALVRDLILRACGARARRVPGLRRPDPFDEFD
jgi:Ribbon-helix-helix protein, copG family